MEYRRKTIRALLFALLFLGCCALVIIGQKSVSYAGFGLMMLGLSGIVACLYMYNKTHR